MDRTIVVCNVIVISILKAGIVESEFGVRIQMISENISNLLMKWFEKNKRQMPWRGESDPYKIWVSEAMLQQTQVQTVIGYYTRWMSVYPTIPILASASVTDVLKTWEGLGYYSRARNLHRGAQFILKQFGGVIPSNYQELLKIPGVGPYIGAAIGSIAFNMPIGTVDGNTSRVFSRLFCLKMDQNSKAFKTQVKLLIESSFFNYQPRWGNQAWMEFGALQCTPHPDCQRCIYQHVCSAWLTGRVQTYPIKEPSKKLKYRTGAAFIVVENDRILMVQRPEKGLLGGMWELPNIMFDETSYEEFIRQNHLRNVKKQPGTVKHQYTHFGLIMEIYRSQIQGIWNDPRWMDFRWVPISEIGLLPRPKVHRKILTLSGLCNS